jgi:LPXTG-motif cell wall-anchored protein
MPEPVTIDSVSSSPPGVRNTGQNIVLDVASLAAGGRITITINGTLQEGAASPQIANRACFTTSTILRPRCAVAGFVRATALPSTGETQRLPLVIAGIAFLMTLGTIIFFAAQRRTSTR